MAQSASTAIVERKRISPPLVGTGAKCGLIMPISATANQSEAHWKDVLKLLHRSVAAAGFEPVNVWESSSGDRISERIIGNIFDLGLAIVDISDLNPNVMFELGLRLSSKKPTIVICNSGGSIPFDIRDFEVLFYPSDLNILGMEDFFTKLEKNLKEKHESFTAGRYAAFLSGLVVDVASPQTREVGFNDLVLSRLDEVSRKISILESGSRVIPTQKSRSRTLLKSDTLYVDIPEENAGTFVSRIQPLFDVDSIVEITTRNGKKEFRIEVSSPDVRESEMRIMSVAADLGGEEGLPF